MNNEQNELKKAYVNLIALKQNLPQQHRLEEKYANMFNSELERLIKLGFDIEDFKIPSEELKPASTGGNYITGEMRYSKNKYVERPVLLIKLDAILAYFLIETPETKIGFKTN